MQDNRQNVFREGTLMIIRSETPDDFTAVREILLAAFAPHPMSQQTEHLIVEGLRADGAMTAALVAEIDGNVVGQIAFSPVKIDGEDCGWLGVGPLAVLPDFQRQGIGKTLVNEGVRAVRELGAAGCILVGYPAYYGRFGFENNAALLMEGIPPEVVLCLPMSDQKIEGTVTFHPAFQAGMEL